MLVALSIDFMGFVSEIRSQPDNQFWLRVQMGYESSNERMNKWNYTLNENA